VNVCQSQPFQPVIAVETGAILAELHQPASHDVGWGVDSDCVCELNRRHPNL
jgi:hypothetical protein